MERTPADALPMIKKRYEAYPAAVEAARKRLNRPLTLAEKILFAHWQESEHGTPVRGETTEYLHPDRVALQDVTGQMALLQFMTAGKARVAAPTTIHCDHLIRAKVGAETDLNTALTNSKEVFDFLASAGGKYGCGFWKPGSGIIHQVVLENYAFPGGLMIGTDSHTPNAGGLGMCAVGVGGADAVDVMVGFPWQVQWPKLIGIKLTGKPTGWTSGKDVILKVAGILTVKGGTGKIVEYFGPGAEALSCTAKATITNMGAEIGATCSVFAYDDSMDAYLRSTSRPEIADLAKANRKFLVPDPECVADPKKYYDEVIEIDLSTLEPHIVGPHTPDLAHTVSQMAEDVKKNEWPEKISVTLIGSCTNSSYEDIGRAAHIARQAKAKGLKVKVPLMVTPGSDRVLATITRDGLLADLEAVGATVLANACGPCIGQWERTDIKTGDKNSILTSYNRNFKKRNDANPETCAFIGSPEVVTAYAFTGSFATNPLKDGIPTDGGTLKLEAPKADALPAKGFEAGDKNYVQPTDSPDSIKVVVDPNSDRLALLEPFPNKPKTDYKDMAVLLKAVGKCTTDHISPAGKWLDFRGHLDNISNNMFLGAVNAFSKEPGTGFNVLNGERGENLSKIARAYKAKNLNWVAVGDENYGEGSSREHAAMCPRHLGCLAVVVRSFARIHETNLKKQGILPLTFIDPKDYEKIQESDRLSLPGLDKIAVGQPVTVEIKHADGKTDSFKAKHTMTAEQLDWFHAGSALNLIRKKEGLM